MPDTHYKDPRLAEIYDFDSGWSIERDFYFALAASHHQSILDLGCGTGLLCDAYASRGHEVTGVDPARAMLDIAERKPNGKLVEWVQASAQTFRSVKRFDLIVMTGHAFQALLTDNDVAAALATMREHLKPGGRIAFESRNPSFDWRNHWNYDLNINVAGRTIRETRTLLKFDGARKTFELHYHFPETTLSSQSELRFMSLVEIEAALRAAGLDVRSVFGGWQAARFELNASEEMIFIAGHRN